MDTPRLSVIIPSYNSALYLEETLRSLLQPGSQYIEVIVVDDHSTDNSLEVAVNALKGLGLNNKVILRPDTLTKGVANTRNYGIKVATAPWIAFLDSDDLFCKGKIQGILTLIDRFGSDCKAYFHGVSHFWDDTRITFYESDRTGDVLPRDILDELIRNNFITTSAVTVNKSLIESLGGFDSSLHGVEDYLMWLRITKKSKWYYSSEIWTEYRVRQTSLMNSREMTHYITQNTNLLKSAKGLNEFTPHELSALEHSLFNDAMRYYALVSLNTYGWTDFRKGLMALTKSGKGLLALTLFWIHFVKRVLKTLQNMKNKMVSGKKN